MEPPPPADGRRPPLVPSHVAWPAFIVFLLTMSVTMGVITLVAANSDGGARIIQTAPVAPSDTSGR